MPIKGVYIFKADSGITLFSKKKVDVQEDLFSAFLSALKGFFSSFELGGLSSFSSETYIFYIATVNNVLTALIVDSKFKSDKYFNLAYDISVQFYNDYSKFVDSKNAITVPGAENYSTKLDDLIAQFEQNDSGPQELINLFRITSSGELESFEFINQDNLFREELFIAVNLVTKKIFIVENDQQNVSSRKIFFANKAASKLNQESYKSEFSIRNVSDSWDLERIIEMISRLIKKESIFIQ